MHAGHKITATEGYALPLGVTAMEEGINFSIAYSGRADLILNIEADGTFELHIQMKDYHRFGDIYAVFLKGLRLKKFDYAYTAAGNTVTDAYARCVPEAKVWGALHAYNRYTFYRKTFDWKDDCAPNIPLHELVMYKLHVRGFTKHASSGVRHKGTFKGLAEKAEYLQALGINCVELMPVNEFQELKLKAADPYEKPSESGENTVLNFWGYGSGLYFAPKAAYASGVSAQEEFKATVLTLHKAGIEVILEMSFEAGTNSNLILDCLRYWVSEYHVDGFHVSSDTVPVAIAAQDPMLSRVKLFSEHFDAGCIYGESLPAFKRLACYHDAYEICCRRLLKGDEDMIKNFVRLMLFNDPQMSQVGYLSNHNGFRLADMVSYDVKHNEANQEGNKDGTDYNYSWNCGFEGPTRRKKVLALRKRQLKNAWILAVFHQGIPLIYAGDEFLHTQSGNNNAYCQDNEMNWLNWHNLKKHGRMFDFVKMLLAFRKAHPVLHPEKAFRMMDYLSCGYPDISLHGHMPWRPDDQPASRYLGVMYCGKYAHTDGQDDDFIYFAYNMYWEPAPIQLPPLPKGLCWNVFADTSDESGAEQYVCKKGAYTVMPRSIVIFVSGAAQNVLTPKKHESGLGEAGVET